MTNKANKDPNLNPAPWPMTLAEVTVMNVDRLRPMCIEQEEAPGSWELARQRDKFRVRMLSGDTNRRRESSLLIEKMYSWRGYRSHAPLEQQPNRLTLTAEFNGHIYGTITVNVDSPMGLGVDETFPEEVRALREQGRKLCEIGKFAVEQTVRSKRLLMTMFHLTYIYAHHLLGCTDLLIEVNPRHALFYLRALHFARVGKEHVCHRVGAPAVLLHLECARVASLLREFGGRWREHPEEKSLYKYGFHPDEESAIVARLGKAG